MMLDIRKLAQKVLNKYFDKDKVEEILKHVDEYGIDDSSYIKIQKFSNYKDEIEILLKQASLCKKNREYEHALKYLEQARYFYQKDILDIYVGDIKIYKKIAAIYRAMKNKKYEYYYKAMSYISVIINAHYHNMVEDKKIWIYHNEEFEQINIIKALNEYFEWLKPLMKNMEKIAKELLKFENENYLKYSCEDSKDLSRFIYSESKDMLQICDKLKTNPFINYYNPNLE